MRDNLSGDHVSDDQPGNKSESVDDQSQVLIQKLNFDMKLSEFLSFFSLKIYGQVLITT